MSSMSVSPGDRAPDFEAIDQNEQTRSLAEFVAKGPVILYFYPKDFTSGCTVQACSLRDAEDELMTVGAQVIGVSPDTAESHRRFAAKHKLNYALFTDLDRRIAALYDTVGLFGLRTARKTFVIDRSQIVRAVIHHEVNIPKHIAKIRTAVAALA